MQAVRGERRLDAGGSVGLVDVDGQGYGLDAEVSFDRRRGDLQFSLPPRHQHHPVAALGEAPG